MARGGLIARQLLSSRLRPWIKDHSHGSELTVSGQNGLYAAVFVTCHIRHMSHFIHWGEVSCWTQSSAKPLPQGSQFALENSCLWKTGITGGLPCFYGGAGNLNSGFHDCTTNTLSTEPFFLAAPSRFGELFLLTHIICTKEFVQMIFPYMHPMRYDYIQSFCSSFFHRCCFIRGESMSSSRVPGMC